MIMSWDVWELHSDSALQSRAVWRSGFWVIELPLRAKHTQRTGLMLSQFQHGFAGADEEIGL